MRKLITLCALFLSFAWSSTAQDRQISGKVTSSQDNLGIPGVTVQVVGTNVGTATDLDGLYKITVPAGSKTLRFTGIGMKSRDVAVGSSNSVDVVMDPDVMKLNEVVVTALGVKREKRSLGYTTKQVTSEELNTGGQSNLVSALSGKVAGANITSTTGAPGGSSRIVLRGGSSLSNNQALIVVDGIPVNNSNFRAKDGTGATDDLNNQVDYGNRGSDINPEDIESISVLEGQTAAALYGSQASNGVVMITTKKGRRTEGGKGKTDVTFSTGVTFSSVLKLPDFQNTYGEGDLHNDPDDRRENFSWGRPFDGQMKPWGQAIDINGDGTLEQKVKPYSAIPDNVRDFFNTGVAYNNSISFAGGGDKSNFYLSFGALNSKGIVPTETYNKYTALVNASTKFTNNIEAGISINYSHIGNTPVTGGQRDASPFNQLIQTPRDIPVTELANQNDPFNKYDDATGLYGFYAAYTINPYFSVENYRNINSVDRIIGNITTAWTPLSWLRIENRFGADVYGDKREQKFKKYDYAPIDPYWVPNNQTYQGKYSQDLYNQNNIYNDLMVTFTKKVGEDWNFSLLLGNGIVDNHLTNTFASTNDQGGLSIPGYYNLANSFGRPLITNAITQTRMISYYAALNFDYRNMLFFSFTGRNDKSSTLPSDNNSYFYPSASVSWAFTELMNKDNKSFLSFGQLRAAYSKVGKDAPPYSLVTVFNQTIIDGGFGTTTLPFGDVDGYTISGNLGNKSITPEFTTNMEFGTRLTFLDERLGVDFTWYKNKSTDQIVRIALPTSSGYDSKTINIGEIQNKGIEVMLDAIIVKTKDWRWDITAWYTKNTNKVVSLAEGVDQVSLGGTAGANGMAIVAAVGHPFGTFYGVDLQRVDQNDLNSAVVVDSSTGMPKVTTNAQYFGSYLPDYQMSFGSSVQFKNWRLNFLFDTKQGGQFYSRTKDVMDFVGTAEETLNRDPYVWPGSVYQGADGAYHTNNTAFDPYNYYTNTIPAGRHLVDASYVKLREMAITYTFPEKMLGRSPFGQMSISVFGNNLFIWTAKENQYVDPEMNSSGSSNAQGFDFTPVPSQRNYGVNLRVTF